MAKTQAGTFFWQGNQACAEGALVAGCRFFAGYPITPASEIFEHMALRLPQNSGIVVQMEDEMAALGAVIGASWTGAKAMTATSGPGFSPSTGQATKCGQGDVMQARWGTHGDYTSVVLTPNSVQEMFELTIQAFNLAETYRTPVVLLADEIVAHMRERITVPPLEQLMIVNRKRPNATETQFFGQKEVAPMPSVGEGFNVAVTGSTHNEQGYRFTADPLVHKQLVGNLIEKIRINADKIADYETHNTDNCDVAIVSFGCTSRAMYEAVEHAEHKGIKTGFIRLKTIWPFPEKIVQSIAQTAHTVIVPEMNLGEILYEVQRTVKDAAKVVPLNKIGGGEDNPRRTAG